MRIVKDDNHVLVVVKDYNMPVQKDSSNDMDLVTALKNYLKIKYNKPGNVYLGLVHRLDRPVGGLMVFAKTSKAAERLSEMIKNKEIEKHYMAVVHGKVKEEEELIDYIVRDENTKMSYIDESGKKAILYYKLINYDEKNDLSLIDVNLITGRHHQIRLQMASHGHPIYGDQKYGIDKKGIQIHLWSYRIKFKHPVKDEIVDITYYPDFYERYK